MDLDGVFKVPTTAPPGDIVAGRDDVWATGVQGVTTCGLIWSLITRAS